MQKSLAEGFGLTVAEAMWKERAVVASAVGGIQDQIVDGESGILLADPFDLEAAGRAASELLVDPARSARIGQAARERVGQDFLTTKHLVTYLKHFTELIRGRAQPGQALPGASADRVGDLPAPS